VTEQPQWQELGSWLQAKGPHDYWLKRAVPDDFAVAEHARLTTLWRERCLPLRVVTWSVTNRCSLRCEHCGVFGGERRYADLSIAEFASAVPDMIRLGVGYVVLTGGEPLLRPDLFDIIKLLRACDFKVGMVTSGFGFSKVQASFAAQPVDSISVSIDGLEASHDRLRGRQSSFAQALATVGMARDIGVPLVTVATCVHAGNLADLPALREAIFTSGAQHWILRPISPVGRAIAHDELALADDQLFELLCFARESLRAGYDVVVADLGYLGPWDSELNLGPYFCPLGWDALTILPNGDVKGLGEDHLPVEGNIRSASLVDIWLDGFAHYRTPVLPAECDGCEAFGRCRGGFVPVAENARRCIKPLFAAMTAHG
jgi:MoaA/NifB/PqqE/SkfB family radical SAM enzyme